MNQDQSITGIEQGKRIYRNMMHTLLDTSEESERIDGGASGCLKGKTPLKDMTQRMIKGLKNRSTGDEDK
jgi:hypothetical protein